MFPEDLAPPLTTEVVAMDEAEELQGRVVGLALGVDGDIVVKIKPENSCTTVDAKASTEALGKSAAKRFGQNVRALLHHEHVGPKSSATLERVDDWEPDDFMNVMRSVRDDLSARGVTVNAAEWLEELT